VGTGVIFSPGEIGRKGGAGLTRALHQAFFTGGPSPACERGAAFGSTRTGRAHACSPAYHVDLTEAAFIRAGGKGHGDNGCVKNVFF